MKTLLLLRHAKSSWKDPDLADHDRPLNKRGKRDAPRIGALIVDEGLTPDFILSSTARRAAATASGVAEAAGIDMDVELDGRLYHADPASMIEVLGCVPGKRRRVLLVAHNPGLEMLLETLTGADEVLPTAALARVAVHIDRWSDLGTESRAELVQLWRPREID